MSKKIPRKLAKADLTEMMPDSWRWRLRDRPMTVGEYLDMPPYGRLAVLAGLFFSRRQVTTIEDEISRMLDR